MNMEVEIRKFIEGSIETYDQLANDYEDSGKMATAERYWAKVDALREVLTEMDLINEGFELDDDLLYDEDDERPTPLLDSLLAPYGPLAFSNDRA
jgi:hypothetical protein